MRQDLLIKNFFLFPYHSDYEFISDQCASSFTKIQDNDSAKIFKKVNTKIEVGETQSSVLFTPISLVKWKWFGIDYIKASNRSKIRQCQRLRGCMSWLRDTAEETLFRPVHLQTIVKCLISYPIWIVKGELSVFQELQLPKLQDSATY